MKTIPTHIQSFLKSNPSAIIWDAHLPGPIYLYSSSGIKSLSESEIAEYYEIVDGQLPESFYNKHGVTHHYISDDEFYSSPFVPILEICLLGY